MERAAAACLLAVLLAGAPAALATRNLLQPGAPRWPPPGALAAACSEPVAEPARPPRAGRLGPASGYGQPGGCMGKGRALQGEGCKQFVEYFRAQADAYMAMNDADFQAVVDKSPAPSATCCHDARNFVLSGCTCSRQLTNSPAGAAVTPTQLRCITRATQASVCGKPDWINDPCQDNGGRPAVAATTASNAVVTLHPTASRVAVSPPAPDAPAPAPPAPAPAPPAPAPAPPAPAPAPAAPAPAPAAPAPAPAAPAPAPAAPAPAAPAQQTEQAAAGPAPAPAPVQAPPAEARASGSAGAGRATARPASREDGPPGGLLPPPRLPQPPPLDQGGGDDSGP